MRNRAEQGIIHLPDWLYVKAGLEKNLIQVIMFYRRNPMAVHSDHFLVKLLQSVTIPQSQNLERYYNNVDALALNLSMALGMTSPIFKGRLFDGVFFGKGNYELLIANDETIDPFEADKEWQNIAAVRILSHPRSDLGFNLPDGKLTGSEQGLAVISINIPLLAIQYRAFRLNEIRINSNENGEVIDSTLTVNHFIHMHVLPNMMYSYLDHVLFNRISNLQSGVPLGESKKPHSFYLTDFSVKLNHVQTAILNYLHKTEKDFTGILQNIPVVSKKDTSVLMELPDLPLTRQVLWGLILARLPELTFLCRMSKDNVGNKNQSEINRILRYFLNYKSDNLFRSMLPLDIFTDIMDDIEDIKHMIK